MTNSNNKKPQYYAERKRITKTHVPLTFWIRP